MPAPLDPGELKLESFERGTRLRLRVKAGARKNEILGVHDGALKVSVTAPPERGKANEAVLALLADRLSVPASSLRLLSGQTSPTKTIFIPLPPNRLKKGDRPLF